MEEQLVEAVSGAEIINDIVEHIRRKLQNSCDLRDTDAYSQSFSASIDLHIKLFDVDTTSIDMKVEIPAKVEPPVSTETTIVTPVEVIEKVEIPQELNLDVVRERSKLPDFGPVEPANDEENPRMPARLKRKYSKRIGIPSLEQAATGGSVDMDADEGKF